MIVSLALAVFSGSPREVIYENPAIVMIINAIAPINEKTSVSIRSNVDAPGLESNDDWGSCETSTQFGSVDAQAAKALLNEKTTDRIVILSVQINSISLFSILLFSELRTNKINYGRS